MVRPYYPGRGRVGGSVVLSSEQAAHGGAAAAEPIGDRLLRHAGTAPAAGTLLPGLASPAEHDERKQDQRQQESGASGDGCHGVVCLATRLV